MEWIVITGIFILVAGVWIAVGSAKLDREDRETKAAQLASISNFDPSVKFDGLWWENGVALDPYSKQIAIVSAAEPPRTFRFDQLVSVEVDRNGHTVTTTKGSSGLRGAAVGMALVGPIGLALGGTTRSKGKSISKITKLSLKIYTNDLVQPYHEVMFYNDPNGDEDGGAFVAPAIEELEQWFGRFQAILQMDRAAKSTPVDQRALPSDGTEAVLTPPAAVPSEAPKSWLGRTFGA
ncbi:hypothetical protein [Sphingobium sp. CR28]|uniref:hypothetical protein n=1 Tax=Sphingobium sp. CR28 TaxID=3400272 RepID=UPI003FF0A56D